MAKSTTNEQQSKGRGKKRLPAPCAYPFLGRGFKRADWEKARAVVLPVESALPISRGRGRGPEAMLRASFGLTGYEADLGINVRELPLFTLKPQAQKQEGIESVFPGIRRAVGKILKHKAFPVMVGGDRLATLGMVLGLEQPLKHDFGILQIDGRAHLMPAGANASGLSSSLATHLRNLSHPICQVGVRTVTEVEASLIPDLEDVLTWYLHEIRRGDFREVVEDLVSRLPQHLYISIDLSVFNTSVMPAVEIPVPGGLTWEEMDALLRAMIISRKIVGMDICGLAPLDGFHAPNMLASQLLTRSLAFMMKSGQL